MKESHKELFMVKYNVLVEVQQKVLAENIMEAIEKVKDTTGVNSEQELSSFHAWRLDNGI